MKKYRSNRRNKTGRRLSNLLLGICTIGLLGSGAALTCRWKETRMCIAEMESLAAIVRPARPVESGADRPAADDQAAGADRPAANDQMMTMGQAAEKNQEPDAAAADWLSRQDKYRLLQELNPDFAGWISIPGTKIDYPVMQSLEVPDYYLNHGFGRQASRSGVPYIAKGCSPAKECPNIVLYGHHMKNGTMFADLVNYIDESYLQTHPRIRFDTLKEPADYRIIGVLLIPAVEAESSFYSHMQAADRDTFSLFMNEVKSRSLYDTQGTAQYGDRLLTLITCEYTMQEGRMVVVAKEIG